jgi:hypothetical protein
MTLELGVGAHVVDVALGRLLVVDSDGRLRSVQDDALTIGRHEVYAMVVLWGVDETSPWLGYVATTLHRSLCFSAGDLREPIVLAWFEALAGWDGAKLAHAIASPGFHLVWRRASTTEIPRP